MRESVNDGLAQQATNKEKITLNKIIVTGGLGRDAELKQTPQGKSVLEFSLAVNSGFKKDDQPSWWKCAIWNERGEKLAQYLVKGTRLLVEGEPKLRQYEDKDGNKRMSAEIFVNNIEFMGSKNDSSGGSQSSDTSYGDSDEVPF